MDKPAWQTFKLKRGERQRRNLNLTGLPQVGNGQGKIKFMKVREKSGKTDILKKSQEKLE